MRPAGRRGGSGTASGVTALGGSDATLEVGGGTLLGVAAPSGAETSSGATGGNPATRGVAVSGGSDAILGATDD